MRRVIIAGIILVLMVSLYSHVLAAEPVKYRYEGAAIKQMQKVLADYAVDHDVSKAKKGYKTALIFDPQCVAAHFALGVMLEAEKDWIGALDAFSSVVKLAPSSSVGAAAKEELTRIQTQKELEATAEGEKRRQYYDLVAEGRALLLAEQLQPAAGKAWEAQKLDGTRWEAYALAGEIAAKSGLAQASVDFYDSATARAPSGTKAKLEALTSDIAKTYPALTREMKPVKKAKKAKKSKKAVKEEKKQGEGVGGGR